MKIRCFSIAVMAVISWALPLSASPLLPIGFGTKRIHENDPASEEVVAEYSDDSTRILTHNKVPDRCPVLSFQNEFLAYLSIVDSRFPETKGVPLTELWVQSLTRKKRLIVNANYDSSSQATWCPSANRLVFFGLNLGGKSRLLIYDVDLEIERVLAEGAGSWPAWSINGRFIAFYNERNEVCLIDFNANAGEYKIISKNVGNRWGLYWGSDEELYYLLEEGWIKVNPVTLDRVVIGKEDIRKVKFVDQTRMNWALNKAGG